MIAEWIRKVCLSFPDSTESVQWGNNLVFKVRGKIFAIAGLDPGGQCVSFKCTLESFAELVERDGIIPAPYLARASWVTLEREDALPRPELKARLRQSYDLVFAKLPKNKKKR